MRADHVQKGRPRLQKAVLHQSRLFQFFAGGSAGYPKKKTAEGSQESADAAEEAPPKKAPAKKAPAKKAAVKKPAAAKKTAEKKSAGQKAGSLKERGPQKREKGRL